MKVISRLVIIGILAGVLLAGLLQLVYVATGNKAYTLLYNVDYIPILSKWESYPIIGISFHFVFCIASVVGLYFILSLVQLEKRILPYFLTYTAGSGILYFLTALSDKPPAANDAEAWLYWTLSHAAYSILVAELVIHWLHRHKSLSGKTLHTET
ncbi:hypothetical protein NCCP2222_00830 [Sporosarcina sp. NCCP-2222]|uniref:hypothetical protein n=1 Tax=Sporosarcina sp. NCCP-2222 TaxID=2935073 RepID=UPI00208870CF|nr:hypothetical protein [Sporosarcina sp. NCCP-2222]GKV54136.1 hypothetical protein NCCP2222_00830 [Sporosarcina sp. NCCP-2222]